MADNDTLTAKQARAVAALMACRTHGEAARQAGIGQRQLQRWLADPVFRAELARAQDAALDQAARLLVQGLAGALDVVRAMMEDPDIAPAVRLRAADLWLTHSERVTELRQLAERVSVLENERGRV